MESLPTIPVPIIVALLAGVFFLRHAWSHSFSEKQYQRTKLPEETQTASGESESVSKESDFPADWYTGKNVYEVERRAIFSKTWLPTFHITRFAKPGDYHSLDLAGFPIFLMLGKDHKIRAFHNVCRHRAYTVTRREAGSSTVLGCRYHGWTYNSLGELVKAPHFDDVPGFEKSQNGLFEINTRVSGSGFVFVNLDAGKEVGNVEIGVAAAKVDEFAGRMGVGRKNGLSWKGGGVLEAGFNWKLGVVLGRFLDTSDLENRLAASLVAKVAGYFSNQKSEDVVAFPNSSFHSIKGTGLFYSLSFLPTSEKTSIRYDLFGQGEKDYARISETLKDFLNGGIRRLERGYQNQSVKIPEIGSPSGEIQRQILDSLKAHTKLEKTSGTEIYPAMRQPRPNERFAMADKLCKDLDCQSSPAGGGQAGGRLAW